MINQGRVAELRDEIGEDDYAEVVALFCEELEETLDRLAAMPRDRMPEALHFLKGSALNIGLDEVSAICRAEERRLVDEPAAVPDIAAIRAAYARSKPLLVG